MVDRLKQSVEHLEPPVCPDCHIEMKWYRSVLAKETDPAAIAHFFQCLNCNRLRETRSILKNMDKPVPFKLSKSPDALSSAA
jgi:hypothetical protein